jgi:hypothetical protein
LFYFQSEIPQLATGSAAVSLIINKRKRGGARGGLPLAPEIDNFDIFTHVVVNLMGTRLEFGKLESVFSCGVLIPRT